MKANGVQIAQRREREKMNNEIKNQMESVMGEEYEEAIRMMNRANSAFERLFGTQEGDSDE